jgi:hypothetical protein
MTARSGGGNRRRFSSVLASLAAVIAPLVAVLAVPQAAGAASGAPLEITSTSLPPGVINTPYSFQFQASGGTAPYTWSAESLPIDFSISTSGLLTGNSPFPTQNRVWIFVQDSTGQITGGPFGIFTVSSGYPQLDPTLFAIAGLFDPLPSATSSDGLTNLLEGLITNNLVAGSLCNAENLVYTLELAVGDSGPPPLCDYFP